MLFLAILLRESSFYWDDDQDGGVGGVGALSFRFLNNFDQHTYISVPLLILSYKQDWLLDIVYSWRGMSRGSTGLYGVTSWDEGESCCYVRDGVMGC